MKDGNQLINPKLLTKLDDIPPGVEVVDAYDSAIVELFRIQNPALLIQSSEYRKQLKLFRLNNRIKHVWVYYPWKHLAVHTLSEESYFEIRTSRNRDIITAKEQRKYRDCYVGIIGLSVGASFLWSLVATGGPKKLKLADFDNLEVSNLNRINASLLNINQKKAHIVTRKVYEVDPYAEVETWDQGISVETLSEFLLDKKVDVFVDEMDDIFLKIKARQICRENRIPVIMSTDNGDGAIIDIERFDLEPDRPIFHGQLPELDDITSNRLNTKDWIDTACKIIGEDRMTDRQYAALNNVGKSLSGVAQLGTAASIAGAVGAFAVRMIATGSQLSSGKYSISPESILTKK